jgi:4-amino-4-deoxy-L-arabinose transferase-like glycosyltransferase
MLTLVSNKRTYFWLLILSVAIILFIRLGSPDIYILDEAKNAQCAREMLQRNDLILPTFNNQLRADKPPLHYYFMMLSYKMFGISSFSARFFSVVMCLLTLLITYFYTKRFVDSLVAFFSVLVLATSAHFLFEFRLAVPDPYLIFFITLSLLCGYTWLQENNIIQLYIAAFSFGLGILTKGPIAIILPGLCLLIWIIWQKKWKRIINKHFWFAMILIVLIALPWYILVHKASNGLWTKTFFLEHNYDRFVSIKEGHGGAFFLPLLFLLIGMLPFMSFIGELLKNRRLVLNDSLMKFSAIVVIVFITFFSFSRTKLLNYAMPCYPFAAIVLGKFLSLLLTNKIEVKKYPYYILFGFTLVLPIVGYFAIGSEIEAIHVKWVALLLMIVPFIFLFFLHNVNWKWLQKIVVISIAFPVFNIIGLDIVYPVLYNQNPVKKTINLVKKNQDLFAYRRYNSGYNFYVKGFIIEYQTLDSLKNALMKHPDALVISTEEYIDSLNSLQLHVIAKHHDLFEYPTTIILDK